MAAHTLYVIRRHRDLASLYGEAPAAIDAAIEGFNRQVDVVRFRRDRPYLLGDRFSAADLLLMTCLDWAVAYRIPLDPILTRYQ